MPVPLGDTLQQPVQASAAAALAAVLAFAPPQQPLLAAGMRLRRRLVRQLGRTSPPGIPLESIASLGQIAWPRTGPTAPVQLAFVGRPWRPLAALTAVDPAQLAALTAGDGARLRWTFDAVPDGADSCQLRLRLQADGSAVERRALRAYLWVVGPLSRLLRQQLLRQIGRAARRPKPPG